MSVEDFAIHSRGTDSAGVMSARGKHSDIDMVHLQMTSQRVEWVVVSIDAEQEITH